MGKEINNFEDFKLNRQLLNAIADLEYKEPTDIQKKVIPITLSGHDVMGVAPTGTGKTAAFVLPILMKVKYAQGSDPRCLIFAPTKELVLQIERNVKELGAYCDLRSIALYGGIGPKAQIAALEVGVDIIVATPGRFMELYLKKHITTKLVQTLVLDEADRMMDMGFMPQLRKILEVIPHKKRQNLLFSATMPAKVVALSEEFLEFPEVIEAAPQATAAKTIKQVWYKVPNVKTKVNFISWLLETDASLSKVILFTRTKANADYLFKCISRKRIGEVRVIHSNKGQNSRINAMEEFRTEAVRVLVSTDVSSRGIDVPDVSHVINFDVPVVYEDYVHRIGRTGRAFKAGKSITLANEAEIFHVKKIEQLINEYIPLKELPLALEIAPTPNKERQIYMREIDRLKRLENPDFKGAFHEKKQKNKKGLEPKPSKDNRSRSRRKKR